MTEHRWRARPWLAGVVALLGLAVPPVVGVAVAVVTSDALAGTPLPSGLRPWAGLLAGLVVAVLSGLVSRRVLSLAGLLQISLLFPDRAPSRLSVARLSGSRRALEERIAHATDGFDDPITALELVTALHVHDSRARGHSERVLVLTDQLASRLRLPPADRDRLRWAALLHDVGKLWIDAAILNKPGTLNADETAALRRHPKLGAKACDVLMAWLGDWGRAVEEHHERYDGTGYPAGLVGDQISWSGRIIAVVDAFEVMTASRSYKRPMPAQSAREELARCAGTHFDPRVVEAFLAIPPARLVKALGPLSLMVHLPFLGGRSRGPQA